MQLKRLNLLSILILFLSPMAIPAQAPPEVELKIIERPNPEETARPSIAKVIDNLYEMPDDFWTHATYGDYLLTNQFAGITIGGLEEGGDNPARSGSLLDIFATPADPEGIQLLQPSLNFQNSGQTLETEDILTTRDPSTGSAEITVIGKDMALKDVSIESTYRMEKSWPGVLAITTVTNDSDEEVVIPAFSDHVRWGAMIPFISGNGWLQRMEGSAVVPDTEFVFSRWHDGYVFIMPTDGLFQVRFNQLLTNLVYAENVKLSPGESRSFRRWILAGISDPADLYSFIQGKKGMENYGFMAGRVIERTQLPDGRVVESGTVPNAEVRLSVVKRDDLPRDAYLLRPYIYTRTDESGNFQISLPPGEYTAAATTNSRLFQPSNLGIKVAANGAVSAVDIVVSKASTLSFELFDEDTNEPLPGKLSLVPLRGTEEPYLGPPGGLMSGNSVYTMTGKGVIEVPAGNYRVIGSHGNEYHTSEKRVRIEKAQNHSVKLNLRRAFKTDGWISADIGVMTDRSLHSRTTPLNRVATAVAEGIDWISTADLNTVTDLSGAVEQLAAGDKIRTSQGIRIASTEETPHGEYILFPLELCGDPQALDFNAAMSTVSAQDAIAALRAVCSDAVLVANRPIFPNIGLLTLQGYDFQSQTLADGELYADVDAFQLWEGKRQAIVEQAIFAYYLTMAKTGETISPIAHSLAAGTVNEEPGYPRIYIPSDTDDPEKFDIAELSRSIKEGRVQITNGPFIDMTVNGESMGSSITDTDGVVDVTLSVYTPNWASVADITVNLNGSFVRKFMLPAGSVDPDAGLVYPKDQNEKEFKITVKEDAILDVIVKGDPSLTQDPVNPLKIPSAGSGMNLPKGQYSMAISAPVFIDADGDGKVTLRLEDYMRTEKGETEEEIPPF